MSFLVYTDKPNSRLTPSIYSNYLLFVVFWKVFSANGRKLSKIVLSNPQSAKIKWIHFGQESNKLAWIYPAGGQLNLFELIVSWFNGRQRVTLTIASASVSTPRVYRPYLNIQLIFSTPIIDVLRTLIKSRKSNNINP